MRRALAAALAVLVLGGCASSSKPHGSTSGWPRGSLDALWHAGGESVGLISGTFDYAPGDVRVSFLVVRHNARQVVAPRALVHVGRSLAARPFERVWATLEHTGPNPIFVAHGKGETEPRWIGTWCCLWQNQELLEGLKSSGQVREIASPRRDEVVDAVRRRFSHTAVRFIHVEVYKRNNPTLGVNAFMRQWRLPGEPWTFLVGADGRIKAKFAGAISAGELAAAVRRTLL